MRIAGSSGCGKTTLVCNFRTTLDDQRARGFEIERVKSGMVKQIIRIVPLIVTVTMYSILTGEDVTDARDFQCFGTFSRGCISSLYTGKIIR